MWQRFLWLNQSFSPIFVSTLFSLADFLALKEKSCNYPTQIDIPYGSWILKETVCLWRIRKLGENRGSVVVDRWSYFTPGFCGCTAYRDFYSESCGILYMREMKCSFIPLLFRFPLLEHDMFSRYILDLRLGQWERIAFWYGMVWYMQRRPHCSTLKCSGATVIKNKIKTSIE